MSWFPIRLLAFLGAVSRYPTNATFRFSLFTASNVEALICARGSSNRSALLHHGCNLSDFLLIVAKAQITHDVASVFCFAHFLLVGRHHTLMIRVDEVVQ